MFVYIMTGGGILILDQELGVGRRVDSNDCLYDFAFFRYHTYPLQLAIQQCYCFWKFLHWTMESAI